MVTYISAIGFIDRVAEVPAVQLILKSYSKLRSTGADIRLPITLPLLERIISALVHTQPTQFQRKLAQAMCSLAFFAALSKGEITSRPGQSSNKIIQLQQISFLRDCDGEFAGLKLTLTNYKHSYPLRYVELLVSREQPVCPISRMLEYLVIRGSSPGPLFCWPDNTPISRAYFTRSLKAALEFCDLDPTRYVTQFSYRCGLVGRGQRNVECTN